MPNDGLDRTVAQASRTSALPSPGDQWLADISDQAITIYRHDGAIAYRNRQAILLFGEDNDGAHDAVRVAAERRFLLDAAEHAREPHWSGRTKRQLGDGRSVDFDVRIVARHEEGRGLQFVEFATPASQDVWQLSPEICPDSIRQFIESVAAEVLRPLATIATGAESGSRWTERSPLQADRLARISAMVGRSAVQATRMIEQFKIVALAAVSGIVEQDVNDLMRKVIMEMAPEFDARGIDVVDRMIARRPYVRGYAEQLRMVAFNLLRNSIDALDGVVAGERTIIVATQDVDERVMIEICDTGSGFGGHHDFAFESLYTTKQGSLGMGLAICQTIVTIHAGHISAGDCKEGKGGWVSFVLPALSGPDISDAASTKEADDVGGSI